MRRLILLFCLYLSSQVFVLNAQMLDSIEQKLDSISDVAAKIEFLNDWTGKNYRKLPQEALFYSTKTLQLANTSKNYSGAGTALIQIGLLHYKNGNLNEALTNYNEGITLFLVSADSAGINRTYVNRGLVYMNQGKYDLAIKDYFKSLNFYERKDEIKITTVIYNNIGLVYKHLKDYDKALEYYQKSLAIAEQTNNISSLYSAYTNIGNIFSIQNKFEQALVYYKENLDVLGKKPNKFQLAQTYHNLGSCFLEMKQYPFAIEYLSQSLQLKEEIGNKNQMISSINNLARIYFEQNDFLKSFEYWKKSLAYAKETDDLEHQRTCNEEMFRIYSYLHQPDSAMLYFNRYKTLRDSIIGIETVKQIAEIETKYETEKKENQISLLEQENKSKKMQRNGLAALLVLMLAYVLFIVRSFYKNKKVNRLLNLQKIRIEWHKHILDRKNQELQVSNQTKNKLFQIISHDLRSPLASVSGISSLISIYISQKRYDSLDETSRDLEQCVGKVLDLTDNLLSWSLNQSGKLPYHPVAIPLKSLLFKNMETYQTFARQKGIHFEMIILEENTLFADRQMLDTVLRNLINNSLKFTPEGGVIILGAKPKNDYTEIWVKDSGVGISKEQLPHIFELNNSNSSLGTRGEKGNGLGLILCKEFVLQNKGEIWVESTEQVGTTFRFTVPNSAHVLFKETTQTSRLTEAN